MVMLVTIFFAAASPSATEALAQAPGLSSLELEQKLSQARLRRAEYYFNQGEYAAITPLLEPLVTPPRLSNEEDLATARRLLGTVYFLLEDTDKAKKQFQLLLLLRPDTALDPYSTAPPVMRFFAEVRREMQEAAKEVERIIKERKKRFEAPRTFEKKEIRRSELLCYFPFGVGQFQNGETGVGVLLLGLETLFLAANITGYILHALLADPYGVIHVPAQDQSKLRQRDGFLALQYAGLGAFALTWAAGAVQARLHFEPLTTLINEQPHMVGGTLFFSGQF